MKKFFTLLLFVVLSCSVLATSKSMLKTGICRIETDKSIGTGFICGNEDTIITAAHVISGAGSINFQFKGGETQAIDKVYINEFEDWAVIKMKHGWNKSKHFIFTPAKKILVGEPIHFYGFKFGNPFMYKKNGFVEGLPYNNPDDPMSSFICLDNGATPGYSGSAILNKNEEVIGIMSRYYPNDPTSSYAVALFRCYDYIFLF